jgi:hypothetical protein
MVLEPFLPGYMRTPADVAEALETVRDFCRRKRVKDPTPEWDRMERILDVAAEAARKEG